MKIVKHLKSPLKTKRYRVYLDDGKHYDFGYKNPTTGKYGSTYLDHKDKKRKDNYWARHIANSNERYKIKQLIPSPALFSAILLWGPSTNLERNITYLNRLWASKKNTYKK